MRKKAFLTMIQLIAKIIGYNLFRWIGYPRILPVILAISVTDRCNSQCKTCNIWKIEVKPESELTTAEYEKIFNNFGHLYWVTIMGGEPFIRDDLFQIIKTLYEKTKPRFLTIPTNGILSDRISSVTKSILNSCPNLNLIINLSMDGVGKKHDEIRGVEGNFEKLLKTFNELKTIDNPKLTVGINTVISKYNVAFFSEIYEFVQKISPDSYVVEIADNRVKSYNLPFEITPDKNEYNNILRFLIKESGQRNNKNTPALIRKLRKGFYMSLLNNNSLPNFEGIASGYIMPSGELWASYSKRYILGNLKAGNYDFKKIWFGGNAKAIRRLLKNPNYQNLPANLFYTNLTCCPFRLLRILLAG